MEAGDREAIQGFWLRGLAQKVDCRKDIRLDQSQSPLGSRLRALRYDRRRLRPPRHDPLSAALPREKRSLSSMFPASPAGFMVLPRPLTPMATVRPTATIRQPSPVTIRGRPVITYPATTPPHRSMWCSWSLYERRLVKPPIAHQSYPSPLSRFSPSCDVRYWQ